MKKTIPVMLAIALGIITGLSITRPSIVKLREDLEKADAEITDLKGQLERARRAPTRSRFVNEDGVVRRVTATDAEATAQSAQDASEGDAQTQSVTANAEASTAPTETVAESASPPPAPPPPPTPEEVAAREAARIQGFMDRIRQQTAAEREAFIEKQNLDETQAATFDTIVGDMNHRIGDIAQQWADYISSTGRMESDYGMRMVHDISGAMVDACNAMDGSFANWRDDMPRGAIGWIDPNLFDPIRKTITENNIPIPPGTFRIPGMPGRGGWQRPPQQQQQPANQ